VTQTPLQQAIALTLGSYAAACQLLRADEREVLRDIVAARLARDYLEALGVLEDRARAA
jgi:hypothetical protein